VPEAANLSLWRGKAPLAKLFAARRQLQAFNHSLCFSMALPLEGHFVD
jgi:hypothetical protein